MEEEKEIEDDLKKNGRRSKQNIKNGRRSQAQFKKMNLIGCDIIVN